MVLKSPTKLLLPRIGDDVAQFLTFRDRSVEFQIKRLKDNYRWRGADPEAYIERMDKLKAESKRCLLMEDEDGPYTYSGLANELAQRFGWTTPLASPLPEVTPIPLARPLPTPFYYQSEGVDALCKAGHGAIELPTGAGKSFIVMELCRRANRKTLVVTPSAAITDQLYRDMQHFIGIKYVGKYGDGSKKLAKRLR